MSEAGPLPKPALPERKRPGRPPGPSDTRERILASARELFARNGIDKTSIRAIATDAGSQPQARQIAFGVPTLLQRLGRPVAVTIWTVDGGAEFIVGGCHRHDAKHRALPLASIFHVGGVGGEGCSWVGG